MGGSGQCETPQGGSFEDNIETTGVKWFDRNELPENLAVEKTTKEQILMCFESYIDRETPTLFD